MEKKFSHYDAIPRQILLEIADVFETLFPNIFTYEVWRQLLFRQKFGMDPDDKHLFIITAIENSDLTPVRQTFHAAPEIIMVQILARRRFERIYLAALWIYARQDMLDRAILASRVHCLKDQEHRPLVLGV